VSYSVRVRLSIIGLSLAAGKSRRQLFEDLLVGGSEGGHGGFRLAAALALLNDSEQDLGGLQIGLGRAVDELGDNRPALADFSAPAVFGNNDWLVQRVADQGRQVIRVFWPAARIAGLPGLKRVWRGGLP
jgi:hypothetical protein